MVPYPASVEEHPPLRTMAAALADLKARLATLSARNPDAARLHRMIDALERIARRQPRGNPNAL